MYLISFEGFLELISVTFMDLLGFFVFVRYYNLPVDTLYHA